MLTQNHKGAPQVDVSILLDTSTSGANLIKKAQVSDKDDTATLGKDRASLEPKRDVEGDAAKKDDMTTVDESEDEEPDDTDDGSFMVKSRLFFTHFFFLWTLVRVRTNFFYVRFSYF